VAGEGPEYLLPSAAARLLHVSTKSLNRWADEGRLRCITTLGGHRRFSRAEIEAVATRMAAGARGDDVGEG
jgi:excisionase family DNA binding protein